MSSIYSLIHPCLLLIRNNNILAGFFIKKLDLAFNKSLSELIKLSEFFGKYVAKEIDSKSCNKILVPKGFAHGFITLDDNTYVSYKTSNFYSAENDKGINIFDKQINITELPEKNLITISSKDSMLPNIDVAELF